MSEHKPFDVDMPRKIRLKELNIFSHCTELKLCQYIRSTCNQHLLLECSVPEKDEDKIYNTCTVFIHTEEQLAFLDSSEIYRKKDCHILAGSLLIFNIYINTL